MVNPIVGQQFALATSIRQKKNKNLAWIRANIDQYNMLKILSPDIINDICFNFPLLYAFIRYIHYEKRIKIQEDESFQVLLREIPKEYLSDILKYLDPRLQTLNLARLNKREMFIMLGDLIQKKCCLENFFIQDLFRPGIIFKESYQYNSYTELFSTSFYYILNCEFSSKKFPLKLNHAKSKFRFPIDVNPIEFERPCILIDVANQFNKDKNPRFAIYSDRVSYLRTHMRTLLESIYERHPEPNLMIFFIHQGDRSKGYNCPEIISVSEWVNDPILKTLLQGTGTHPFDRKALYISIPCHLFLAPEPDYPRDTRIATREFYFNVGDEPGYPGGGGYHQRVRFNKTDPAMLYLEQVKNIMYDRYGRILVLPDANVGTKINNHTFRTVYGGTVLNYPSAIPYYSYTLLDDPRRYPRLPPFRRDRIAQSHAIRHGSTPTYEGENPSEKYVRPVNECSGHTIFKNEIDDYMVGLLCLIHYKISTECSNFSPYRAKWILFTHDQYRWMNPKIIAPELFIRHTDLLSYLQTPVIRRKRFDLLTSNIRAKEIIQDIKLYPYKHNYLQYVALLDGIIRINHK